MVKPGINWRSSIDIDEENRLGKQFDPNRVIAVMTLHCETCKGEITEIHFADGRKSYDSAVASVLGEGVTHMRCPQ